MKRLIGGGGTGTVSAAGSGTAAAPGIAFASDPNTGIYSPGADQLAVSTGGVQKLLIDSSGKLEVQTPTVLPTTQDNGVVFTNTSAKTYPTTSSFGITAGLSQNIELGTAQTIDPVTPGGFNNVRGIQSTLTKSAGNTQDIERLNFTGFVQVFRWEDDNTCKQYIGINDSFNYFGIDANGRTSTSFNANTISMIPPDGGTQTVGTVKSETLYLTPAGSSTINITNSRGGSPQLRIWNTSAGSGGTKTINITNHAFFETNSFWGVQGAAATLNATITNLYGLRLKPPSGSTGLTITNNWGIYQEWSSANNWFAGASNQFPNITTTASGANAFLDSADSNRLYRSTSSIVYKKDVENLDHALADNIHQFRPVWYRSNCDVDCQDWSWFGLIAEEVAAIEPRLVHYGYQEDAYELVDITDTVDLEPDDPRREAGQETEEITKQERRLKDDAQQVPNGVAYDRLTVLLLDVVQRQEDRIKDLEARLTAAGI
jgi:hypothetical protein